MRQDGFEVGWWGSHSDMDSALYLLPWTWTLESRCSLGGFALSDHGTKRLVVLEVKEVKPVPWVTVQV